ncbi:probable inactive receptor kinase At2g26730 [Cornus florida]|uniref:probable inactive receptor kinase At2g26730 n=1 Tax=Cornus florida TaxID=4283 RepID=UPI00289B8190|nr:probable inactive receptor kinase At2g26730 [Cornus florida]
MLLLSKMNRIPTWVLLISFYLLLQTTKSETEEVKSSLIKFFGKLSNMNSPPEPAWGWNLSSDPCRDQWMGIGCDIGNVTVKKITLDSFNFSGTLDANALCDVQSLALSLTSLSISDNKIFGEILDAIGNCRQLTHLYISGNQFSGSLPSSVSRLVNLKKLDLSNNNLAGDLPDLTGISGLTEFSAQKNHFTGAIPDFEFSNLFQFNVSFNNFSGPIPSGASRFPVSSFTGNTELCGDPLPEKCPPLHTESEETKKSKGVSSVQVLMFSGYFLIGLVIVLLILFRVCRKKKTEGENDDSDYKVASFDDSINKSSFTTIEYKTDLSKSEILAASADQSALMSSSLIVLTSPVVNGLRFEDLLKAPAELLGRGKHGSVYKVICEEEVALAVKRIKNWGISSDDFKTRMRRLDQVKHPNVLPAVAFYCSRQEKLLVYEYQQNGSLLRLLHGTKLGQPFDWSSRLGIAASIAEALTFMHHELSEEGIAHGNLKSSNILLNKNMEPYVSEYGLMEMDTAQNESSFKADIYGFGVILLELLTGKLQVQNNGMDVAKWVLSVVHEEWTGEVFDKTLIQEGASEERLVNLLQVAIKCINRAPETRPSINQVALMLSTIRDDEERSIVSEVSRAGTNM